jgi:hypothetical protein
VEALGEEFSDHLLHHWRFRHADRRSHGCVAVQT